ncbi:polysaccharide biosynthesis/export family protein [Histidinibacterium lentulum]|uniref:Polysaccharide export protein n=1 Tax=Histidinibacterium lentulum TaxID=2480588 RepID=A0A3N2R6J1_9RHOB|nr:polysaccharide biosynthesis/export family protein [Histidinibacterium lentulum]ROU02991.1 polysaccharide export protein [Histidinibacterium lentulum]
MRRLIMLLGMALMLGACTFLPRGAGLQREILNQQHSASAETPMDFSVAAVVRENLATFAAWPDVDHHGLDWIRRIDQPNNRIIAAGDTISITIWSTEDNGLLTAPGQRFVSMPQMRVSSSGTLFLPYIGTIRVAGMSPETARARIEEQYLVVTPSAQVQLEMTEGRANTVSLVSGVVGPGVYPLPDRDFTVMNLIAEGGGIQQGLRNPQVRLQRGSNLYGTSASALLDNPALDTTLVGGDKVYVESDERYFLSLGAAGSEQLHPFAKDSLSALDAMSIIGGLQDSRADPQGILILREYPESAVRYDGSGPDNTRMVFTIDLTSADGLFSARRFEIESGDLVYVAESPLTAADSIVAIVASAFGAARQANLVLENN